MKKLIYKTLLRTVELKKIDKLKRLYDRVVEMYSPGNDATTEKIQEEMMKFLEYVPNVLDLFPICEQEYALAMGAAERATEIMQRKGREAIKDKNSVRSSNIYREFIGRVASTEINQTAHMSLRTKARDLVDFQHKGPPRKGSWVGQG